MKLLKSLCAVIAVCAMIICVGVGAFADAADTYSIEIPDGFTLFESEGQTAWKNGDGDIVIELAVSENTSNVKVNPNEADESYMNLLEEKFKASVTEVEGISSQVVSVDSGFVELGENDAVKVSLVENYTFENGEFTVYRVCYVFETENYIHSLVVVGDEDIFQFADDLVKTVKINDTAVELRFGARNLIKGALMGALIGAAVGVVIALAKKFTDKKKAEPKEENPVAKVKDSKKGEAQDGFFIDGKEELVIEDIFSIEENEELEDTQVVEENV